MQEDPEPHQIKEEQEMEPHQIKEKPEELEPHQIKEVQEEQELQQIKEEPEEQELQQIKEEPEEQELQQIKEEAVSPLVKEEQEEHFITPEAYHLLVKQETDSSTVSPAEIETGQPDPNKVQLFPHSLDASMLDIKWQPQVNLFRIDFPHHYVYKEEKILSDQQLPNQGRNSNLDLEEPHLPQMEEEEGCSSWKTKKLVQTKETESLMIDSSKERDQCFPSDALPDTVLLIYLGLGPACCVHWPVHPLWLS
ncbi:uncharacterized protein KZ484_021870 isoform 2-T2 [Pholidichthys leucotaenia]